MPRMKTDKALTARYAEQIANLTHGDQAHKDAVHLALLSDECENCEKWAKYGFKDGDSCCCTCEVEKLMDRIRRRNGLGTHAAVIHEQESRELENIKRNLNSVCRYSKDGFCEYHYREQSVYRCSGFHSDRMNCPWTTRGGADK